MWEKSSLTVAYLTLLNMSWKAEEPRNRTLYLIYPPLALLHWWPRAAPMACHLVKLPAAGVATARCTLHHGIFLSHFNVHFWKDNGTSSCLFPAHACPLTPMFLDQVSPGSWIITGGFWKWIFPQVSDGWGLIDLAHVKWGVREAQNPALNNSSTLWNVTGRSLFRNNWLWQSWVGKPITVPTFVLLFQWTWTWANSGR